MRGTRWGHWFGRLVLKSGLISSAELHVSGLNIENARMAEVDVEATHVEVDSLVPGYHLSPPLNLEVVDSLANKSCINILLPSLSLKHMSGGPNTALLFAAMLAESGERVRLFACDAPAEGDETTLYLHMDHLLQRSVLRDKIELVDAFDRSQPSYVGVNDIFFATAWWTAQMAKYATEKTIQKTFIYLIQDFEPILHEGSTFQSRALETYGFPHIPLINTQLLLEHLIRENAGCYANTEFAADALSFEPALDRNYFYPDPDKTAQSEKKVLLFYARPTSARRNLFEMGIVALRQAVASGTIDNVHWELWAMGEAIQSVALGNGVYLNPLPWMSFEDYARRVRTADLMLSLMLSPHPSYPPLEMAASGKLVVTNSFSVKTADFMRGVSHNVIVAKPTTESIGAAIENAAGRINTGLFSSDPQGKIALPANWDESLNGVVSELICRIEKLRVTPSSTKHPFPSGYPSVPRSEYESYRTNRLTQRRSDGDYHQAQGLLSFVTSAYNTAPEFLVELGNSLFVQDGGMHFEWLILDNGSTNEETIHALQRLSNYPNVRLERVEDNLGIVGGMRYLLERAQGRYVLPLDSDDLLEPDCVHVLSRFIGENDYPPLVYTDEDKLEQGRFGLPYFKPDWDPVLFLNSCYIAHLCAIDREMALSLGCYSDDSAEGCHDWDSFIRFMVAGYLPCHIPEVLYSWRVHDESTSGNIASKTYVTDSHRAILTKALMMLNLPYIELVNSPFFHHNVDWWFRRKREQPLSCVTLEISNHDSFKSQCSGLDPVAVINAAEHQGLIQLEQKIKNLSCELVHLFWRGVIPDDDEWRWEATGLIELFPDMVMVGGTLHDGSRVLDGPRIFGFGTGVDCPDRERDLTDPGFSAWMHKHRSVSAVSSGHCVVTRAFLMDSLPQLVAENVPLHMLGPWLGALALEKGKRIIFSPFMPAKALFVPEDSTTKIEQAHFLSRFWSHFPDARFYSARFGLTKDNAYMPVSERTRNSHMQSLQLMTLSYQEWFEYNLLRRGNAYPISSKQVSFTLITTVYENTDVDLLNMLAESVVNQSVKAHDWIIVAHGPISASILDYIRRKCNETWNANLIINPIPLGIMGAMRKGLEEAKGEYIVPVDADDIITMDAIQILSSSIVKLSKPDLVYSDEDLLIEGRLAHPYLRAKFDPIMNLDSSYIWHLCAIKRECAFEFGLYTDSAATWCHDWDTVMRIANAGGRIEHVPEVLYHWRQHSRSITNNSDGDSRSLDSVRHILNQQVILSKKHDNYFVTDWSMNRGSRELYIERKTECLPRFVWGGDNDYGNILDECQDAILIVAAKGILIKNPQVYSEVARLFELHPKLGAVGGLVIDNNDMIIDGCYIYNDKGEVESPWVGRHSDYAGPYALAMKTQTVAATGGKFGFFQISVLNEIGCWPLDRELPVLSLLSTLCARLWAGKRQIAFSPLVQARIGNVGQCGNSIMRLPKVEPKSSIFALSRYGCLRCFKPE